jgi:nickel-dependent lactate racemase
LNSFTNPYFTPIEAAGFSIDEYAPAEFTSSDKVGRDLIEQALAAPIGSPTLESAVRPRDRVVIVVDDLSRTTPVREILPLVLKRLHEAGTIKENIEILIALGTHRPMSEQEMAERLGAQICRDYAVYNHAWGDPNSLILTGETSSGLPIWLNKRLLSADYIIGIGHIVPHRVAGFSGGGKIIQPGVSGPATTGRTHWMSAYYQASEILGQADNPVRQQIEEVALAAGLRFIVNVVQDRRGRLVGVFAGHPIDAHRAGCRLAESVFGVKIKRRTDIVIAESVPSELDLWQATKALQAASIVVKPGGAIVLLAECPEGISRSHGDLIRQYGFRPLHQVKGLVKDGCINDLNVASYLARVGNVIARTPTWLVSRGISPEEAASIGFLSAVSPSDALAQASVGRGVTLSILRHGGEILPLVENESMEG